MPKKFKPIVDATTVYVQGRLSYQHLLEPAAAKSSDKKFYSCVLLIDKKDKESIEAVKLAIKNAFNKGITEKWKGKAPKEWKNPLRDGEVRDNEEFQGKVFFNCKSARQPAVLDRNKTPILNPEEIYSGMWVILCVNFFPFENSGTKGVGGGLNAVLKIADDEAFSSGMSGAAAFNSIEIPEDEDDDNDLDV